MYDTQHFLKVLFLQSEPSALRHLDLDVESIKTNESCRLELKSVIPLEELLGILFSLQVNLSNKHVSICLARKMHLLKTCASLFKYVNLYAK